MFDIGFLELLIIGILSLIVMGPERLPGAIRTTSLWIARIRRSFQQIKTEIEREVGADEIKQQLHNETILGNLEKTHSDILEAAKKFSPEVTKEMNQLKKNLEYDIDDAVNPERSPTGPTGPKEASKNNPS